MSKRRRKVRQWYSLKALRNRAIREQSNRCYWCHQEMLPCVPENIGHPRMATADHKIPLHEGGATRPGNIIAACAECNEKRHPELNKTKEPRSLVIGEDRPSSPFEVLRALRLKEEDRE